MKRKLSKKIVIGFVGIVLLASAGYYYMSAGEKVETTIAGIGDVAQIVSDNGVVEAEGTITLTAKTPVEITKIYADEGDYVEAGDLIFSNNDSTATLDIDSLRAQASGLAAQAANANTVAANSKTLYEAGAISQSEYTAAKSAAAQLNSQVASLNYSIESYRQGSGIGGLVSPISGYITEFYGNEGETISAGMNLVEISPLEKYYVTLNLIPDEANKVEVGNMVSLLQDELLISDACVVERISKKAKEVVSSIGISQKRVEIVIAVPGEVEGLLLGDNIDVEITTALEEAVLTVPSKSIFEKEGKDCLYIVENGKAVLTSVEIGLEGEEYTQILDGIQKGAVVILSPGNSITDGSKVKV